jgi:transposase
MAPTFPRLGATGKPRPIHVATLFTSCNSAPRPSRRCDERCGGRCAHSTTKSWPNDSNERRALLKNPGDLTDHQAVTLRELKRKGGDLWRAYALKEALRPIFAGDLSEDDVGVVIDRFCSRASSSGLKPLVTAAKTIRKRKEGILAAVRLGINNAQRKGLNRRVRLIVEREIWFLLGQMPTPASSCSPSGPSPT